MMLNLDFGILNLVGAGLTIQGVMPIVARARLPSVGMLFEGTGKAPEAWPTAPFILGTAAPMFCYQMLD